MQFVSVLSIVIQAAIAPSGSSPEDTNREIQSRVTEGLQVVIEEQMSSRLEPGAFTIVPSSPAKIAPDVGSGAQGSGSRGERDLWAPSRRRLPKPY